MILTVHDELLFEAPEAQADQVAALITPLLAAPDSWTRRGGPAGARI